MKKIFACFLFVLVGLSALALWLKPARMQNGKIVLSYACVEFWAKREQAALFEKLNPKYEVKTDVGNTETEKVIIQSVAGVGPDLFNAYGASQAAAFINAGIAWDITEEMKAAGIDLAGDTWPATHSFTIRDGRVYGFPYAAHTDALFYNKGIFDSLGISYPASPLTRDAFLDLAQAHGTRRKRAGKALRGHLPEGYSLGRARAPRCDEQERFVQTSAPAGSGRGGGRGAGIWRSRRAGRWSSCSDRAPLRRLAFRDGT